ncbi:hypothetical protein [Morganella morganii]|uniref:hypothetical protein n=1 Tax=Morganella morganii TaxID=582 RepID=UPI000C7E2A73|nr:hypothetical protein [Morganella morganii]PLA34354.1 hypothetical protein CYJ97_07310 [Morganella morganii]QPJ67509.1 hypothetical protein IR188_12655 [Morganella morganii]
MEPWQPGQQLLTDFDIKLGRLAASAKNRPCTPVDIKRSCDTADLLILLMMRQDQNEKRE